MFKLEVSKFQKGNQKNKKTSVIIEFIDIDKWEK